MPFPGHDPSHILGLILQSRNPTSFYAPMRDVLGDEAVDLLKSLLCVNNEQRIDCATLRRHPFLINALRDVGMFLGFVDVYKFLKLSM